MTGIQLYEEYTADGVLREKSFLDVQFRLVEKDEFIILAEAAGFRVTALYGDYACAPFDEKASPFMIWELSLPDKLTRG